MLHKKAYKAPEIYNRSTISVTEAARYLHIKSESLWIIIRTGAINFYRKNASNAGVKKPQFICDVKDLLEFEQKVRDRRFPENFPPAQAKVLTKFFVSALSYTKSNPEQFPKTEEFLVSESSDKLMKRLFFKGGYNG